MIEHLTSALHCIAFSAAMQMKAATTTSVSCEVQKALESIFAGCQKGIGVKLWNVSSAAGCLDFAVITSLVG
jgi:hypothetical protein